MTMHWIDWAVVLAPLIAVVGIAIYTQCYVHSVADFLAAGRCAGRYLVCNALTEAGTGAISIVAFFELFYHAGFAINWWQSIAVPVGLFMTLTGFIVYRYRETRALTMAQFFEMRYSKKFRVFMGIVAWVSGIINYGIFPAVGARFFVYFCGFPEQVHMLGLTLPTFALVMACLLPAAMIFTLMGGQLTAMVIDSVENIISGIMFVVIAAVLLYLFPWHDVARAMTDVPAGQSLLDPFETSQIKDFNYWYVLIGIFGSIYGYMAWQGNQGFNCAAANPHEARMGRILGNWRVYARNVMIMLLAICALTFFKDPTYAGQAASATQALQQIRDPNIQSQMRVPVALAYLLPIGIKGMFCSIMLFGLLACDSSYLHSWGSIFIQDVVLPFRKTPLSTQQHMRWLRWSIAGVAVFAFLFSLLFHQTQYILMFFAMTGTIYLGGAGAVIIGGLYWKKGTAAAAWVAMILGSGLGVGGIVLEQTWKGYLAPPLLRWFPHSVYLAHHANEFPINGQWMWAAAMASATAAYLLISLLTCRGNFNMDRMLHRGPYKVDELGNQVPTAAKPRRIWHVLLGIDEHFTVGDRFQSVSLFVWSMFWFVVFVIVTIWNLIQRWPTSWWATYWYYAGIILPFVIGIVTTIWFTYGGIKDLRLLFRGLNAMKQDASDDGTVAAAETNNPRKSAGQSDLIAKSI